jgi:GDPmannose 4,6-dehydratase
MRAEELPFLRGDAEKARSILRWNPEYTFEMIMDEMIEYWQRCLKKV